MKKSINVTIKTFPSGIRYEQWEIDVPPEGFAQSTIFYKDGKYYVLLTKAGSASTGIFVAESLFIEIAPITPKNIHIELPNTESFQVMREGTFPWLAGTG